MRTPRIWNKKQFKRTFKQDKNEIKKMIFIIFQQID